MASKGIQAINDKIKLLEEFQRNANKYAIDAVMANEHIVVDMNFEEQLYMQGINSENIPIMNYEPYSPATIFIKKEKHQPYDRVTLRDTGDFHSGGYVERTNANTAELKSDDIKSATIQERYGKEILGLTDDNMKELKEFYVKPYLIDKLKNG